MRVIGLVVSAVLAASCTSSHQGLPTQLKPGQRVRVHTRDGESLIVTTPPIHGAWRTTAGELIPASEVASYVLVDHGKGAGHGALYGLASGAVAGIAFGLAAGESCTGEEEICIDRASLAPVAAVSLGLVGALLGAAFGGLAGYSDVYVVSEAHAARASF